MNVIDQTSRMHFRLFRGVSADVTGACSPPRLHVPEGGLVENGTRTKALVQITTGGSANRSGCVHKFNRKGGWLLAPIPKTCSDEFRDLRLIKLKTLWKYICLLFEPMFERYLICQLKKI